MHCCWRLAGCSRQQSDWEKTRAANTTDAYEQFLKKYPSGEFTAQAQARVKELYEERDWQKARDTDTQEAYQAFLKQYPEGKWTEEARIRVENFTLAQPPANGTPAAADERHPPGNTAGADASATGSAPATPAAQPAAPAPSSTMMLAMQPHESRAERSARKAGEGSYGCSSAHSSRAPMPPTSAGLTSKRNIPRLLAGLSPTVSPKKSGVGNALSPAGGRARPKNMRARSARSLKAKVAGLCGAYSR